MFYSNSRHPCISSWESKVKDNLFPIRFLLLVLFIETLPKEGMFTSDGNVCILLLPEEQPTPSGLVLSGEGFVDPKRKKVVISPLPWNINN